MNRNDSHPDNDAIALLARALTPIFAAALAQAANEPVVAVAIAVDHSGNDDLPRAA